MKRHRPSIDIVWLAMPLFVIAVRTLLQPVTPEDYWWSVVMGDIIRMGGWPDHNVFLYTVPAGKPFYPQAWLAQWAMATLASAGHVYNYLAHVVLLLSAWTALIIAALRRKTAPVVTGVMAAAAYYMAAGGLAVRTQMFAYPLFVLFAIWVLEQAREPRTWRWGALAVVAVVWANVHGTFVFAPLLCGAAGAGVAFAAWRNNESIAQPLRRWGLATLGMLAAVCVCPGGVENLRYVWVYTIATHGGPLVVEWQPPPLFALQGMLFWGVLVASWIWIARRRDVSWPDVAVFALVSVVTAASVRALLWWGATWVLVLGPSLSRAVADRLRREETSAVSAAVNTAILVAFVVVAACCVPGGPIFDRVDPRPLYGRTRLATHNPDLRAFSAKNPVALAERVASMNHGHIFAHQHASGLLEWAILRRAGRVAAVKPSLFVDQRLELLAPDAWGEYFTISRAKPRWRDLVDRYEIRTFVLNPDEQKPLIDALMDDDGYELAASSGKWVVFTSHATPNP